MNLQKTDNKTNPAGAARSPFILLSTFSLTFPSEQINLGISAQTNQATAVGSAAMNKVNLIREELYGSETH